MINDFLEKINKLKSFFIIGRADSQDVAVIDSWEGEAKRLFLLKSLKEHDGIKYLLEIFQSEVARINDILKNSYSKDLSDYERDRLLDKRDLAQRYLNILLPVDDDIDKLEEMLDVEINKM